MVARKSVILLFAHLEVRRRLASEGFFHFAGAFLRGRPSLSCSGVCSRAEGSAGTRPPATTTATPWGAGALSLLLHAPF